MLGPHEAALIRWLGAQAGQLDTLQQALTDGAANTQALLQELLGQPHAQIAQKRKAWAQRLGNLQTDTTALCAATHRLEEKVDQAAQPHQRMEALLLELPHGDRVPMRDQQVGAWLAHHLALYGESLSTLSGLFDGQALPIERCYTQLALIAQPKAKQEKRNRGEAEERQEEPGSLLRETLLANDETIHAEKKPIALQALWQAQQGPPPGKLLLWGRAGIGKTTLCKRLLYGWHQEGLWAEERLKAIIYLPLHPMSALLKQIDHHPGPPPLTLGYLPPLLSAARSGQRPPTPESLQAYLEAHAQEILWLLDGYDQIADQLHEGTLPIRY